MAKPAVMQVANENDETIMRAIPKETFKKSRLLQNKPAYRFY